MRNTGCRYVAQGLACSVCLREQYYVLLLLSQQFLRCLLKSLCADGAVSPQPSPMSKDVLADLLVELSGNELGQWVSKGGPLITWEFVPNTNFGVLSPTY